MLKELALNAPTFFFQQVQPFFENISNTVRDPKVSDSGNWGIMYYYVVPENISTCTSPTEEIYLLFIYLFIYYK